VAIHVINLVVWRDRKRALEGQSFRLLLSWENEANQKDWINGLQNPT